MEKDMSDFYIFIMTPQNNGDDIKQLIKDNLCVNLENGESKISIEQKDGLLEINLNHPNKSEIKHQLLALSQQAKFDFCLIEAERLPIVPKLVVFDMDSTLIPIEVIDQLAEVAGVKDAVSEITERAMQGELDFDESFKARLSLLKGMSEASISFVKQQLTFNPGVENFCHHLHEIGAETAIASGGFVPFAQHLSNQIQFSEIKANELLFEQGQLTGEAVFPIVNAQLKANALQQWAEARMLEKHQTIAIGDGANDLLMMQAAGLGVAYHAKPKVNLQADCVLQFGEMDSLILLFSKISKKLSITR